MRIPDLHECAVYRGTRYNLSSTTWHDGTVAPDGYRNLRRFYLEDGLPVWRFRCADAIIERRLWMPDRRNETRLRYTVLAAGAPVGFEIDVFVADRDHHGIGYGATALEAAGTKGGITVSASDQIDAIATAQWTSPPTLRPTYPEWETETDVYAGARLDTEMYRGLPDREDLMRVARTIREIAPGDHGELVLSVPPSESGVPVPNRKKAVTRDSLEEELVRRREVVQRFTDSLPAGTHVPHKIRQLVLAADQFIVDRHVPDGGDGTTIIAGYPWFGDWGRDTMISVPGLTVATGRLDDARWIIRTFAKYVDGGMLPNLFPDGTTAPEYNTVDATLWYFEAIRAYLAASAEIDLAREIIPVVRSIIEAHMEGTRYGIGVDGEDGLLAAGEDGVQLTWMDARIGDWVVTPRRGKPVEINALWHHALLVAAALERRIGEDETRADEYENAAAGVAASFSRFVGEHGLYDVIDGPNGDDPTVRPNQLFAVSLAAIRATDPAISSAPLVSPGVASRVVEIVGRELLTPVGVRSLSPQHPAYRGTYGGSPVERDAVYHQGPVWGWLIGPYLDAHLAVHGNTAWVRAFVEDVVDETIRTGCLGTVAEIYDGDAPHKTRGAFAQAWSVAELLRVWRRISDG